MAISHQIIQDFAGPRPEEELFEVPCNNWPHRNQRGDGRENAYEQGTIKPFGLTHIRDGFLLFQFAKLLIDPFTS